MEQLPSLTTAGFSACRDSLHNVAKVLGKFQQAFLAAEPHDWHYGLVPVEVGLATPVLTVAGEKLQLVLDMQAGIVRIGSTQWSLDEYAAPELLNNLRIWLAARSVALEIAQPEFGPAGRFDAGQSAALGRALWQVSRYAQDLKAKLNPGLTSPVLVYPHHFDLSLVWFPKGDDGQLSLGFSMGDATITEPYLYLSAYPEPAGFNALPLPDGARWQIDGFRGAVLPYQLLQVNSQPYQLFTAFAEQLLRAAAKLQ